MPKKLDPTLTAQILDHLSSPEGRLSTIAQIAQRFGVSIWTVHNLRRGTPTPRPRPLAPPPEPPSGADILAIASSDPRGFIEKVLSGSATMLSTDQQRSALSELILHTPNPSIKVAAQNALTRLDAQAGGTTQLGPGPPLTDDGRIDRLSRLMSACGARLTRRAFAKAFPSRARAMPLDSDPQESEAAEVPQ
jgi:hypothetical protein